MASSSVPRLLPRLVLGLLLATFLPVAAAAQGKLWERSRTAGDGYWRSLGLLAAGAVDDAVRGRAGLAGWLTLKCLDEVRLTTLDRLAAREPESLLPIAVLESAAFLSLVGRGDLSEMKLLIDELPLYVERYLESTDTEEADRAAARVLTSIANTLLVAYSRVVTWPKAPTWRDALQRGARRALLRAHDLDASQVAALHLLAVLEERDGHDQRAVGDLEELHRVAPDHAEARLRLARGLLRTGEAGRGEAILRTNLEGPVPDWVRIVSYQELGRLLADTGRPREALALLGAAVKRFPRNERLAIQLAHLLYAQGEGIPQVVDELLSGWQRTGQTPRSRYEAGPIDDLIALNEAVRADVEARLPQLARGVAELRRIDRGPNGSVYAACEKRERR